MDPGGQLDVWGDRAGGRIPRYLGDLWGRENEVWGDGRGRMDWGGTLKPKGKEELCVVLADRWIREKVRDRSDEGEKRREPFADI